VVWKGLAKVLTRLLGPSPNEMKSLEEKGLKEKEGIIASEELGAKGFEERDQEAGTQRSLIDLGKGKGRLTFGSGEGGGN